MANSLEYKRTHYTHFPAPSRKMKYKTIAEKQAAEAAAKKRRQRRKETPSEVKDE